MNQYSDTMRHVPYIIVGVLILCVVALLITSQFLNSATPESPRSVSKTATTTSPFDGVVLEARAAIVVDARNNTVLFEKNAHEQLPLASVTKILSVLVAYETFPRESDLTVTQESLSEEGDSGLVLGERWALDDLLRFILVTSSNDGIALIEQTYDSAQGEKFIPTLDRRAREIGLSTFSIRNATGLDAEDTLRATNYGSARDVATLFSYALLTIPDILDATRAGEKTISSYDRTHTIENTNEIIDRVPNAVGGKTGFTDAAGGNLVMSFDRDIGSPIIIVVLGSSKEGRFTDMERLVDVVRSM